MAPVLARAAEWTVGLSPKVGTWHGGRWGVGDEDELVSGCWCTGHGEMSGRLAVRYGPGSGLGRDTLPPPRERMRVK